jgi:hypothetical protein
MFLLVAENKRLVEQLKSAFRESELLRKDNAELTLELHRLRG